jgi:hypothetical protein
VIAAADRAEARASRARPPEKKQGTVVVDSGPFEAQANQREKPSARDLISKFVSAFEVRILAAIETLD